MAPLGMESKHITHDYEIEGIESSGPMEVDAPRMIHCASRKKMLWYFVLWKQLLLSNLVHVSAVMIKLGKFF